MSVFVPLSFETHSVGKIIKRSKKRYTWKILLDGLDYNVDMYYSKVSSKVKVFVNNELALDARAVESQSYKFYIRYRPLVISQVPGGFDLSYGSKSSQMALKSQTAAFENPKAVQEQPKSFLRRSLPCALPQDIPAVSFRKNVRDIDLLEINPPSNNPFDFCEDTRSKTQTNFKSSSLSITNSVPWPNKYLIDYKNR
jgi:hypothetical protein